MPTRCVYPETPSGHRHASTALDRVETFASSAAFTFFVLLLGLGIPTALLASFSPGWDLAGPLILSAAALSVGWGFARSTGLSNRTSRHLHARVTAAASTRRSEVTHMLLRRTANALGPDDRRNVHPLLTVLARNPDASARTINGMVHDMSTRKVRPHPGLLADLAAHPNLTRQAAQNVYYLAVGWQPGIPALGHLVAHHPSKLTAEQASSVILASLIP